MPNLNKVLLIGRLTRDPELRVMPKGTPICQFSIAINRDIKADTPGGEKRSEVIFVDIEAWGKSGEAIAKYLTKGRSIYLEGRLKLDQWEDKNTREKRSRMKVVLESFQFLDSAGDQQASPTDAPAADDNPAPLGQARAQVAAQATVTAAQAHSRPALALNNNLDDDVPF